jgi:ribonuclease G
MQSAFVDLGLERDGFLYVSDVVATFEEFDRLETDDDDRRLRAAATAETAGGGEDQAASGGWAAATRREAGPSRKSKSS